MNLISRLRQIVMVGGIESFGVIISGIAGLLIVNILPKDQYAAYTFLVACMTLILGATDLGLAHCCLPVVGQRNKEVPWVVGACHQVFRKRWPLLALGLLIVVPYWFVTARQHQWSGWSFWIASALIVFVVLLQLREHYGSTILTILGHIPTLYRVAGVSYVSRIVFVGGVLLLPITAYSMTGVVAATAATTLISVFMYRGAFKKHDVPLVLELPAADSKRVDTQIFNIAKHLVLPAIFYQFQGVITVFLVSFFGTTNMLAEVGAFGRLAMVLIVVDRVTGILLFPAIARAPDGPRLGTIVMWGHLAYFLMMGTAFLTAVFLPQYWILLLGEQYRNMAPLVWMVFLAAILMNAAGFAFRTLTVRGATAGQTYIILTVLATQIVYLWLVGVPDLKAVLGFGIATSFANFAYQYVLLSVRWFQWRK